MATSTLKAAVLEKIILNENIYIYKKKGDEFYPQRTIRDLFNAAIEDKDGQQCKPLFTLINEKKKTSTEIPYKFSALVLKYTHLPTFLSQPINKWVEQKLAYLFLLDFGSYLILLKKNIGGINNFINNIDSLDYEIISKLLIQSDTLYEKFSLQNLDISNKAMRAKSVESDSLVDNYNYIGSNTYIINHLRLNNDSQRYLISLNTSRISKSGEKISIDKLAQWCYELIVGVENFVDKETYLDIFARPCNYEKERASLEPTTVTVLLTRLVDEVTTGRIDGLHYQYKDRRIPINIKDHIKSLSVSIDLDPDSDGSYLPTTSTYLLKGFHLRLYEKSIRLNSARLRRVIITKEGGTTENLIDYLNYYNCFVVNFNQCELVYSNKRLFKDSSLLGSIEYFFKIFEPHLGLVKMVSEKGNVAKRSTTFDNDCVFGFVEQQFNKADFLVLDDLGDEWADHIAVTDSTVTFIHSKHSDAQFSATAFTDIVGQTQKNIGNMFAVDTAIRNKKSKWSDKFKLEKVQSAITRLRKGKSVDDFIDHFIKVKLQPNPKRSVYLSLNFISKKQLEQNLSRLKKGEHFGERKQAIQILWFISSLIASCRDNSIEVTIFCKP